MNEDDRLALKLLEVTHAQLDRLVDAMTMTLEKVDRIVHTCTIAESAMGDDLAAYFFKLSECISTDVGYAEQIRDRIDQYGYAPKTDAIG
ncbi:MAG: hypothetical protein ABUS54_10280 [Actinomycetota bacterium]